MVRIIFGRTAIHIGHHYERLACRYLESAGLVHIESNYRSRCGELDLVMRDGRIFVFVEVRYRRHSGFGGSVASVGLAKQRRLINTGHHYLQRTGLHGSLSARFDVVGIDSESERITWLKNAFSLPD